MSFIEKHKVLIITSLLMGIFVLGLYNITMFNKKKKEQAEILMEMPPELIEELTEEEPEPEEEQEIDPGQRTHQAFNEDFEDHDQIAKRIKSLTETKQSEPDEDIEDDDRPSLEEASKSKVEETTNNRYSSSRWSLHGRSLRQGIPNPVYTCEGRGKVVVKIEVNKQGKVISSKIDKKKSSTRNECLLENAMKYARKALFSTSYKSRQPGTITYYFNYQS